MKMIHIQIQPNRDNSFDESFVEVCLNKLGLKPNIEKGHDDGPYVNYNIDTDDLAKTWNTIKNELLTNCSVRNTAIICCEGVSGWDDYLLLYHYDQTEQVDEL